MTSILISAGFRFLESLEEFSLRFPDLPICKNDDFQKILICHATNPINLDLVEIADDFDYNKALNIFMKRIDSVEENVLWNASLIFEKIYNHFDIRLTCYIVKNSFLFYNWGWNSVEIITNHNHIFRKISKCENNYISIGREKFPSLEIKSSISNNVVQNLDKSDYQSQALSTQNEDAVMCNLAIFNSLKKFNQNLLPLKSVKRIPSCQQQEIFNIKKILYDDKKRPQLPKNHVLSANSVDKLLGFIIALKVKWSPKFELILLQKNNSWVVYKKFLQSFLKNHTKLEKNNGYGRLLKKHLKSVHIEASDPSKIMPISRSSVSSYILDILRRVLPREFYANNNLKKKFFSFVVKVLNGQLEENFIWEPCLNVFFKNKIKILWCQDVREDGLQNLLILKTLKFILVHFIFVIVKNHFYVTETGVSGYGLRFFHKADMEKAIFKVFKNLVHSKRIKLFKRKDADIFSIERHWLDTGIIDGEDLTRRSQVYMSPSTEFKQPVAAVRFLPKNDLNGCEMRIITSFPNLKPKFINPCEEVTRLAKEFKVKLILRKRKIFLTKLFLEFLIEKTCVGLKPVPQNPKLEEAWRKAVAMKIKFGKLYFVKADITNAFDSILHNKLLQVLEERIREGLRDEEYIQLKRISEWRVVNGKIKKTFRLSFGDQPQQNSILLNRSDFVCDKNEIFKYRISEFLDIINQVALQQRISIKNKLFKLSKGLAQGSAGRFSSQLCEIYYSSMDKTHFEVYLKSENCILLRGVDDYLLLTTEFDKAKEFLKIVRSGIRCFNVTFNDQKLKTNLGGNTNEFGYLGLIFDFNNMSVKPDYSKYENKNFLRTMKLSDKFGDVHFKKNVFFAKRITRLSTLKLQPILLKTYNDNSVVKESVFQAGIIQSLRVMTLADYLFEKNAKNDLILAKVIFRSCRKFKRLISSISEISEAEIMWLFLEATVRTFRKRSGQFKILLQLMRFCQKNFETLFRRKIDFKNSRTISHGQINFDDFLRKMLRKDRKQKRGIKG